MSVPRRVWLLRAASLLACWTWGRVPAQANCIQPDPAILWSSPAQGAVDVPLDADLLLVMDGYRPNLEVRLDDRILAPSSIPGIYDLGQLEPSTEYAVTIGIRGGGVSFDGKPLAPRSLTFTTGSRRAQLERERSTLEVTALGERTAPAEPFDCDEILYANSCYDTGPPVLQTFAADPRADSVLWIIETIHADSGEHGFTALPSRCGSPQQLTGLQDDGNRSYVVHAVSVNGAKASSAVIKQPFTAGEGCAVGAPGAGASGRLRELVALSAAALLATGQMRRRRRAGPFRQAVRPR